MKKMKTKIEKYLLVVLITLVSCNTYGEEQEIQCNTHEKDQEIQSNTYEKDQEIQSLEKDTILKSYMAGQFKEAIKKSLEENKIMIIKGVGQIVDKVAAADIAKGQC